MGHRCDHSLPQSQAHGHPDLDLWLQTSDSHACTLQVRARSRLLRNVKSRGAESVFTMQIFFPPAAKMQMTPRHLRYNAVTRAQCNISIVTCILKYLHICRFMRKFLFDLLKKSPCSCHQEKQWFYFLFGILVPLAPPQNRTDSFTTDDCTVCRHHRASWLRNSSVFCTAIVHSAGYRK